jgi:uncharacterized protein YciI
MTPENEDVVVPTVTYYLVLLVPSERYAEAETHFAAHVGFIDRMAAENVVLLGGSFAGRVDGADGGYLLHTKSAEEAAEWAAQDPFIANTVFAPRIVPWHLVGISRGAIDPVVEVP